MPKFPVQLQHFPLYPYHLCSLVGFLPFQFNLKTCKISLEQSSWRRSTFWLLSMWILIRGGLSLGKCVKIFFAQDSEKVSREFIPFIILSWFNSWLIGVTSYLAFKRSPEITMTVFNEIVQVTSGSRKTSVQDLIIYLTPWNIPIVAGIYGAMILIQPNAPFSLYSLLPERIKSAYSFGFILTVEIAFAAYLIGIIAFLAHMLILFFEKCMRIAWKLVVRAERGRGEAGWCTEELLMRMRAFQLLLSNYNDGFAYIHFTWKIMSLLTVILLMSAGIFLIHDNIMFSLFYITLGSQSGVMYSLIFRKAFLFPIIIGQFKLKLAMKIKSDSYWNCDKRYLSRLVKAIPNIGIKVGEFHTFGRMSTPNFVGFVTKNIVRALIALRGY